MLTYPVCAILGHCKNGIYSSERGKAFLIRAHMLREADDRAPSFLKYFLKPLKPFKIGQASALKNCPVNWRLAT